MMVARTWKRLMGILPRCVFLETNVAGIGLRDVNPPELDVRPELGHCSVLGR